VDYRAGDAGVKRVSWGVSRIRGDFITAMAEEVDVQELLDRAEELETSDRWEEALATWAEVAKCCHDENLATRAGALARRVWLLAAHHRRADAITAADQLSVELAEDDIDDDVASQIAFALYWRARCLEDLGRSDDAVRSFRELAARFSQTTSPYGREQVAAALSHAASILEQEGRPTEAVDVIDDLLVALPKSAADDDVTSWIVRALRRKAAVLGHMGRRDEAVLALDAAIRRLGGTDSAEGLTMLSGTLEQEGKLLFGLERFEDAIEVFDQIVALARSHPGLETPAVVALTNKIAAYNQLGCMEDAVAAHEQLLAEFGDKALGAYDETIRDNSGVDEFLQREAIAGALAGKASVLAALGRPTEAIEVLTQLIESFEDESQEPFMQAVAAAREGREELRGL
jgi:tetratricopeptide (TPR) repeat protein